MVGLWAENPLFGGGKSVECSVSKQHVLFFDSKFVLEGWHVVFWNGCSIVLHATNFILVTLLEQGSDFLRRSAVVVGGSEWSA